MIKKSQNLFILIMQIPKSRFTVNQCKSLYICFNSKF